MTRERDSNRYRRKTAPYASDIAALKPFVWDVSQIALTGRDMTGCLHPHRRGAFIKVRDKTITLENVCLGRFTRIDLK